jgi:predicted membrane protein
MINMEAAKYTFKVVGIAVGIVSSVVLFFWFLITQYEIFGLIFGCLFVIICLASTVVYGQKKSEIEFKKRYNR